MTRFTPLWQQAGSYPAQLDRALINTLWPAGGAQGAAATVVTNTMNMSIPAGTIAVPLQSGQNTALCRWDAAETVTSPAAPAAGTSRIDMVVCQVRDPQLDAGVNNDFIFVVVSGTAVANPGPPIAPAVPANAYPVCQYTVAGGIANLNGVTVTDLRRPMGVAPAVFRFINPSTVNLPAGASTTILTGATPALAVGAVVKVTYATHVAGATAVFDVNYGLTGGGATGVPGDQSNTTFGRSYVRWLTTTSAGALTASIAANLWGGGAAASAYQGFSSIVFEIYP